MIFKQIQNFATYTQIVDNTRSKKNTAAFGVCKNQKPYIVSMLDGFVVYVANDFVQAQEVLTQLNNLQTGYEFLPAKEEVLLSTKGSSATSRAMRSNVLYKMQNGLLKGVVTTIDAMCQKFPYAKSFAKNLVKIAKGETHDIFDVTKALVFAGYQKADQITTMGEFTRKGDILDVYCPGYDNPIRIEFFGDEVEDIRVFDKVTKKSINKIDKVAIVPLNQFFAEDFCQEGLENKLFASVSRQKLSANDKVRLQKISDDAVVSLDNQNYSDTWLLPFVKHSVLADYFPKDAVVVWDEPKQVLDRVSGIYDEHYTRLANLVSKGEILPESKDQLVDRNILFNLCEDFVQLVFQGMSATTGICKVHKTVHFKSTPLINYQNKLQLLSDDISNWTFNGYRIMVFAEDKKSAELLQTELMSNEMLLGIDDSGVLPKAGAVICPQKVLRGFVDHDNKFVLVGVLDLFAKLQGKKQKVKRSNDKIFTTPDVGDYVVHEVHGIGLCQGIVSMEGTTGTKDYIVIQYKASDVLYVPVDATNLLSKYSGGQKKPTLNRLGGNEFAKVKERVKAKIKEMAIDLVKLYAARENARGFSYPSDTFLEDAFAKSFPHNETIDQLKCLQSIKEDLEGKKIMDRLVCGDVGYGKTEVALRAAFKVLAAGKQVAFLAPTTILSEQHFKNTLKRMDEFGFHISSLNRFRSKVEQKKIVEALAEGSCDMVCGTHRLLSKDVKFKDLGLLILDEEQRFGVEAKERIKSIKTNVDVLTLSATPIPRTLHMALTGMRDISVIQTPPKERVPVETYVIESSDSLLADAILRETNRGGQVYVVYNRVESIDGFTCHLQELLPNVSFGVAHGQMGEGQLEKKIFDFTNGMFQVLVCSTIIENGIDIPNANTIIVYDANLFGLSQLYQLRGRVGRSNRRAFAYFMYQEGILTQDAYKRLQAIGEYTELGSGFKIAMRDLEIRGAGNVLGAEQHGHMEKVGYDMYCKLLTEAMEEIKGEKVVQKIDTVMDVAIDGTANKYILDSESRMAFYQRLASISSDADADELLEEITDIYGTPPKEVLNLLDISLLKQKASSIGVSEITIKPNNVCVCFFGVDYLQTQAVFDALDKFKNIAKLDVSQKLAVVFDVTKEKMEKAFDKVYQFVALASDKSA